MPCKVEADGQEVVCVTVVIDTGVLVTTTVRTFAEVVDKPAKVPVTVYDAAAVAVKMALASVSPVLDIA
jgi:hypothetical protein